MLWKFLYNGNCTRHRVTFTEEEFIGLDYRNILRVASDPHKSMRTMELELLFPEEYQKTALYVLPDYPYIHG